MKDTQLCRSFVKTLLAAWRQLCYKLTYHRFFSISLKRWIWALVILPPLAAWIGQLSWTWAVLLAALGAAALIGAERARRKQYIVFAAAGQEEEEKADTQRFTEEKRVDKEADQASEPDPSMWAAPADLPDSEVPIKADEPLRCWASGRLSVEGKTRALAGERASISFVRTREHIVMAQVRRTRFLLLAPVSKADVGYWYAFFYTSQVQSVRQGTLYCGFSVRPGIELRYAGEEAGQSMQLVLAFEDFYARQRLLDDLRQDVDQAAF